MKNIRLITSLFLLGVIYLLGTIEISAQEKCDECKEGNNLQPSIMVLPRTVKGEDLRTIMDEQPEVRFAVSKLKQAFDDREYTTMDFETTLTSLTRDETITKDSQTEFKNRVFRNIPSDIIVEIDLVFNSLEYGNRVTLLLEANVTDNGNSMASVPLVGDYKNFNDKILLIGSALKKENDSNELLLDEFLRKMNEKWSQMCETGKTVKMEFSFAEDSDYNMNKVVKSKDEKLKYVIEDWLEETALNNYYIETSVTETKLIVSDYRYPIRDPKNCSNMTARKIERKLDRFFDKIGVPVKFDNSRGSLYINIQ